MLTILLIGAVISTFFISMHLNFVRKLSHGWALGTRDLLEAILISSLLTGLALIVSGGIIVIAGGATERHVEQVGYDAVVMRDAQMELRKKRVEFHGTIDGQDAEKGAAYDRVRVVSRDELDSVIQGVEEQGHMIEGVQGASDLGNGDVLIISVCRGNPFTLVCETENYAYVPSDNEAILDKYFDAFGNMAGELSDEGAEDDKGFLEAFMECGNSSSNADESDSKDENGNK